jgi:hypothetical protein
VERVQLPQVPYWIVSDEPSARKELCARRYRVHDQQLGAAVRDVLEIELEASVGTRAVCVDRLGANPPPRA